MRAAGTGSMSSEPRILPRRRSGALIGPNAVLQAVAVMEDLLGAAETRAILLDAQIHALPSGEAMIPEVQALRLHRWLALHEPMGCLDIAEEAGARTADYIIANRIPKPAVWLLRRLPAALAAPLLMAAIRKHAWTFIGAGSFTPQGAWQFTIDRSKTEDAVPVPESLYHWYAAVFARLYRQLVAAHCTCQMLPAEGFRTVRCYRISRDQREPRLRSASRLSLRSSSTSTTSERARIHRIMAMAHAAITRMKATSTAAKAGLSGCCSANSANPPIRGKGSAIHVSISRQPRALRGSMLKPPQR
jgi:divinyl protochlorophyllide a 8-vinyl-reductase